MTVDKQTAPQAAQAADIAGIPDTSLRSALEFAVGIAAAGVKLRPPLVFPAALKAYLKLDRLDRPSLHAVRRAVVGDADFLCRIGAVASIELVDEIGIAWLQRKDGWERQVRDLHAATRDAAEEATIASALRKAERRREAAETVAARANAELIGLNDTLVGERRRREKAEQGAAAASAESSSLRTEIAGLRREVDKLVRRMEAETARAQCAEGLVEEVRGHLGAAERTRDEILAARAAASPERRGDDCGDLDSSQERLTATIEAQQTTRAAVRALEQAAASTQDLARALGAAADGLFVAGPSVTGLLPPAPGRSTRQIRPTRASQRKPIAIPGGVYGDSLAAATHIMRTRQAVVIVDGYNVAKLAWPSFELIDQRRMCIELLEDMVRRNGTEIRVVFDGADVVGASAGRRLVRVQFSRSGVSADDVIRAEVRALPTTTPVVVVTNDQAIVTDVRGDGANVVSSEMLLAVAGRPLSR